MTEPESDYEKLRRASRELGERREFLIKPIEETEQYAAAVQDEAPVVDLTTTGPAEPSLAEIARRTWPSPVSAWDVARVVGLRTVAVEPTGAVWWQESRPDDDGGYHLIRRDLRRNATEVTVAELAVERDGDAVPVPGGVVTAGSQDGRLYLLRPGERRRALTARGTLAECYTDLVRSPDGRDVYCVRHSHDTDGVHRSVVAVPLDGSGVLRTLISSPAFLSNPVPSPDGTLLAWLEWDPPHMPWDGSRLRVGRLASDGVAEAHTVLGGDVESLFQPEWASADSLYVASDRTRWWNLYQVSLDGTLRPLCPAAEEFGWPRDRSGTATYGRLADGRLAVLHGFGDWRLDLLDPANGTLTPLDLPYTAWQPSIRTSGNMIAGVAGTLTDPAALVSVDATSGRCRVLRQAADGPPAAYVPRGQLTTFSAHDGHDVHAVVYPPRNPGFPPAGGERVPFLLFLPESPGVQATHMLDMVTVWFTSRGFGVAVVHCRGSSGYGRAYREQIYGRWGAADVEDCATVAHGLVDRWSADPDRIAVRGKGAGGTLALEALANTDLFAAATVYAPITDLPNLIAVTPHAMAAYLRDIAGDSAPLRPASWLARIRHPVLMFHGERDSVVPVGQTLLLRDALRSDQVPHTCLTFPTEDHDFRHTDTVISALDTELTFYARALSE